MKQKNNPNCSSGKLTRRTFVKGLALGTAAAGAPVFRMSPLAASGQLNIIIWSDYLQKDFIDQFKKDTGITVNVTGIGSNDELINKMKATKGRGFDLAAPTNNQSARWKALNILQPFDFGKLKADKLNQSFMKNISFGNWAIGKQDQVFWLPHVWGTEAVAWNTEKFSPKNGTPSFGDVWSDENAGKSMVRAESSIDGVILYMESTGELDKGSWLMTYDSEDKQRKIYEKAVGFIIQKKKNLKKFWNDSDAQTQGFLQEGVVIGQCWDGPTLALKSQGKPYTYQAPKEGAFSWVDGLVTLKAAQNKEEINMFLNYQFQPKNAATQIAPTGYNSAVAGAENDLSATYKKNFSEAYPGDALEKLNPWPVREVWHSSTKSEFEQKILSA